jgi:hypothetical protein
MAPRFSLIVPTRNRARTLGYHLKTCLAQEFGDFEVIVSDNYSPPETREVALSFNDPRIKYFRTPADLALTDSLEFAFEKATGEFVSMLGDDDGYMLHALRQADDLLRVTRASALRWDGVLYNWPDIAPQGYAEPNALILPLRQGPSGHVLRAYKSVPMMQAAANAEVAYSDLPSVYSGVVRREVFDKLRQRSGRLFRSRTADVYAAFAVASMVDEYYSIAAPMTIAGASGNSTGIARHFARPGSPIEAQFRRSSEAAGHAWHATIPDLPPIAASVADAALHLREALPDAVTIEIDRRRLVDSILRDICVETEADWQNALAACRRALADDASLLEWFDATHARSPLPDDQRVPRKQADRRYGGAYMALDAATLGVGDVMGAAELCEKLLGYRRDGMRIAMLDAGADPGESLSELQAKERKIQEMHKALMGQDVQLRHLEEQLRILDAQARALASNRFGSRLKRLIPSALRNAVRSKRGRQ